MGSNEFEFAGVCQRHHLLLVSFAAVRALRFWIYREMLVLEVLRDPFCLFHFNLFGGGIQSVVRFAAFRRAAHVSGRVRQRDARFGHANKFHRLSPHLSQTRQVAKQHAASVSEIKGWDRR